MATRPRAAPRSAEGLAPGSWVATPTAETMAALHLVRARARANLNPGSNPDPDPNPHPHPNPKQKEGGGLALHLVPTRWNQASASLAAHCAAVGSTSSRLAT